MYFLSDVEQKFLTYKLLPVARKNPVNEELRGWNWRQEPLKPYYEGMKIPMYSVTAKYCPTNRDLYLRQIEKNRGAPNYYLALGKILHGVVSDSLQAFMQQSDPDFDSWWSRIRWNEIPNADQEKLEIPAQKVWDYTTTCKAKLAQLSAEQPFATKHDLTSTVAPFLIEHKMSGELLGLSGS